MICKLYNRVYYKCFDVLRKFGFLCRRFKYYFHPDIKIGNNVRIGKNVSISVLYGGKISIGDGTEILDGCKIWTYGGDIIIGNDCSINPLSIIYGQGGTIIGDDVLIAGHNMIIPSNHKFKNKCQLIRKQGVSEKGIIIKNNVWIAHGCTILDGVTINKGSVIGAGSVVNKDTEEYTLNVGVPAKLLKRL